VTVLVTGAAGGAGSFLRRISASTRAWWSLGRARVLGYPPPDDAEAYAAEILAGQGEPDPADPELRFAGGRMAAR
jgi:uronate dehydrogenase